MKTNIGIETSDDERNLIAQYLERDSATKRLATRKEITELVQQYISDIVTQAYQGEYDERGLDPDRPVEVRHRGDLPDEGCTRDKGLSSRRVSSDFKPSRGDEPYLYKPKSVALKDACSAMLDQAEIVEQLVWDVLEANREK